MRPLLLAGHVLVLLACCPIPFPEEGLEVPELDVQVTDAQGAPVVDATVTVRRYITAPGPHDEISRTAATTDARGLARFPRQRVDEVSAPLMMHGRPDIGFEVCAEKAGGGSVVTELEANGRDVTAPAESLVLTLDPTQPACAWPPR